MYQKLEARKEKWLVWDCLVKLQMWLKPTYSGGLSALDITGIELRLSLEWAMVANSGVSPNWQQLETMTIWVNASQAGFRTAVIIWNTFAPCCSACTALCCYTWLCYKVQLCFMVPHGWIGYPWKGRLLSKCELGSVPSLPYSLIFHHALMQQEGPHQMWLLDLGPPASKIIEPSVFCLKTALDR